jgi:hypothetical protein
MRDNHLTRCSGVEAIGDPPADKLRHVDRTHVTHAQLDKPTLGSIVSEWLVVGVMWKEAHSRDSRPAETAGLAGVAVFVAV